jgi:exosortase A
LWLGVAAIALFALTFAEWRAMAHQWWNIDTYSHILLVPPIIGWVAWIRREEIAHAGLRGWWPGVAWTLLGLSCWALGRALEINTIAQGGAVVALQGAVLALLGLRAGIVLAFPLAYAFMLVPFGDEIIPPLQMITAEIATAMTRWSGIEMVADGILIDTPAGLFIVAEECSGVKFLIAMVALGILVAHTCFSSWHRRTWFLFACIVVPVIANGIRAWATIFIAQYVGAEAAGGFDHIVYGWFFFALVLALVLGVAWRWFEREPEEAGWSADEIAAMRWVEQWEGRSPAPATIGIATLLAAGFFAVFAQLV